MNDPLNTEAQALVLSDCLWQEWAASHTSISCLPQHFRRARTAYTAEHSTAEMKLGLA